MNICNDNTGNQGFQRISSAFNPKLQFYYQSHQTITLFDFVQKFHYLYIMTRLQLNNNLNLAT